MFLYNRLSPSPSCPCQSRCGWLRGVGRWSGPLEVPAELALDRNAQLQQEGARSESCKKRVHLKRPNIFNQMQLTGVEAAAGGEIVLLVVGVDLLGLKSNAKTHEE